MKIAIIGTGISGLLCGRLLHRRHQITLFDANDYVGGHVHTIQVPCDGETHAIDTGFIVYNERTYPKFSRLLGALDVPTSPTTMSFSVRCDGSGLEYSGTNLNGLFAQRLNLARPSFLRMVRDIVRFNRQGTALHSSVNNQMTVAQFAASHDFCSEFVDHYLIPMGSAIWSCPGGAFAQFPIRFILEFFHQHGLLSLWDRPIWRIIDGGSDQYVRKLTQPFRDQIRLRTPVRSVARTGEEVVVSHRYGQEAFDEVIFACHSDQAMRMLDDPTETEQEILAAFPYASSVAVLHTDQSVLPRSRRAWAAWNYHLGRNSTAGATVTYHMNRLQHIRSDRTFLVTLNEQESIDPNQQLATFRYAHPVFTTKRSEMQSRHHELIRQNRSSFCGAWWGAGFHEDGVNSAVAVCEHFGIEDWFKELIRSPGQTYQPADQPLEGQVG